ncbi:MAG: NAD(P)/FAD-dependent oxidoreductase, partial [Pseudolabrys sp.]
MRQTDIVIAGAGLAGSTAAAMLARAGYDVVLVDPHTTYPPDFRCEKLDSSQIEILKMTGLADAVLKVATPDRQLWIARFGRLVEKRKGTQCGIFYDHLVNTIRAEVPSGVFVAAKVTDIATSADRQVVTLSTGETISARLFVLANGLNIGLRHQLGIDRKVENPAHSVSIGFDIKPTSRAAFDFSALTYYPEHTSARMAYVVFFPIGAKTRANLFVYRDMDDPWLKQFRDAPKQTILEMMPNLAKITGAFDVDGFVKIRPVDLYVSEGHRQPGVVLIGDAFATSCPAAGTGAGKAFVDVERLLQRPYPAMARHAGHGDWKRSRRITTTGVKRAYDAFCTKKAYSLKSLSIDPGLTWAAQRWARFIVNWLKGVLRPAAPRTVDEAPALVPAQDPGEGQIAPYATAPNPRSLVQ